MHRYFAAGPLVALIALALALAPEETTPSASAQPKKEKAPGDETLAQVVLSDKNLKVEVWAAEPLFTNPVCFCFDEKGRCYVVETHRHSDGVPDTRGKPWLDDDLACRTVADRVALYKKYKYNVHPENSEIVRMLWDSTGSGKPDKSVVFADGFNRPEDGIAAGVLARKGTVYFACIPELYALKDTKGANKADEKKSLANGFGVHVQYIGHDLHGLRMGPDGKLYMSCGDRGFNITTKEGRKLFNPDCGAVLRCDPDGSNLEIVHIGLRNPQELAFDDFGNLFTFDNNSDSGDRARWVHIVEGGESGWRGGFQYGTYYNTPVVPQGMGPRGPFNVEKLWYPQWDGQPAYIVPPLLNFGNGPSGLTHYPGIGLNDKYKDHFFCTDFTGSPGSNSIIWTLAVKPKGAGLEVVGSPEPFIRNMLPTDCEFGPDGAFYWSDWTSGWDRPNKGRIFRVTDPEAMKNPQVAEAKKLIAEGFEKKTVAELAKLLEFPHQTVRQETQFELASRKPEDAITAFAAVLKDSKNRLARLHAVWGLGMVARTRSEGSREAWKPLIAALADKDVEIKRTATEQLGSVVRYSGGVELAPGAGQIQEALLKLVTDESDRVKAAAAVAYGKIGQRPLQIRPVGEWATFTPLFDLLKTNNDKDPYLRHAAVMGLVHLVHNPADLFNFWKLAAEHDRDKYDVPAVRMGVLLALRKHGSEKCAEFLGDSDARIVAEAARAIYDERLNAGGALAKLAEKHGQPDAISFRALAANFVLGTPEAAERIANFAAREGEADYVRAFALKLLGDWPKPPRRDPIMGTTIDLPQRDARIAADALLRAGGGIFVGSDVVRKEASQTVAKLNVKEFGPAMAALVKDAKSPSSVRVEALFAVEALHDSGTKDLAAFALASDEPKLRAAGRTVLARLDPAAVLKELPALLKDEKTSIAEKQGAFAILASFRASEDADKLLDEWLGKVNEGKVPVALVLDVLDAAERRAATPKLKLFAQFKAHADQYRTARTKLAEGPKGDKLAPYSEALEGGDAEKGRTIFLNNSAVYCQRCHKLDGQGGEVGPALNGIAADKEKDRRYLLESVVFPNAKIAKGYETAVLTLADDRVVSGIIKSDDKKSVKIITAEAKEITIPAEDIVSRRTGPSAMPDDLHKKLTRRELRDVVEFLSSLKELPKK
jgi:quinoprotein glucose dehydrogenase